nr:hypothetical protein [Tanacetum cinerariifolium]
MFHMENVNYLELIWEDFQYQIDYRQSKMRLRKIIPYPRFTKNITNHYLSFNPFILKGPSSGLHTFKDYGIISRLKFVKNGEDFQEYGRAIPNTMLTKEIRQTKAYQTFITYSIGLIPSKKSRGKSVSLTEAEEEEEAARHVHANHECLVKESNYLSSEPSNRTTCRRRTSGTSFRDTSNVSSKKSLDQSQKLKGINTLTAKEQLATNTMQALKASRKISRSQSHTKGSSKGAGVTPEVPDESTSIFTTIKKKNQDDNDDDRRINPEEIDNDDEDDKYIHDDDYVHNDVDEEMKDAKVNVTGKDDNEGSDIAKADAKKTEEVIGDNKKAGLPLTCSSLFVSSGKTPPKSSKSGKSITAKEPDEEHVLDMSVDVEENIIDEMGNVDENPNIVDDQPEQTWFNDLVFDQKDPLIFDELMATPIEFSKSAKIHLKLEKITKTDLVGPVYNLLKGTYQSSNELEYKMEECYKAQTDKLDLENPKGDRCLFDLNKLLPLKGHPSHLTIASEYFFNNDLEYLKSTYSESHYTTLIIKKAARYEFVSIEDMILKQ